MMCAETGVSETVNNIHSHIPGHGWTNVCDDGPGFDQIKVYSVYSAV